MPRRRRSSQPSLASGWFFLFAAMLLVVCFFGGSSRSDVLGQVAVRGSAAAALIVVALFGNPRGVLWPRATIVILLAICGLIGIQLIPLPPALWQALPGHAMLAQAIGNITDQPWRPLSVQPDATLNALMSMLVPICSAVLLGTVPPQERRLMLTAVLTVITLSALVGLNQFSGTSIDNPVINDVQGEVSGLLANRNHFALMLAIGCLVAPAWALLDRPAFTWRAPLALGLTMIFVLLILASGSRAGLLLGAVALLLGPTIWYREWRRLSRSLPRWTGAAAASAAVLLVAGAVTASYFADRAQSITRAAEMSAAGDQRSRSLPTVIEAIQTYFPGGAGFGTFDTTFRIHEPLALLKLSYFNHAHNDYLEIVLDGGILAALLLLCCMAWWLIASWRVWQGAITPSVVRGRLGSAMIALVLVASAFDYPARTPLVMMILVIALVWLEWGAERGDRSADSAAGALPSTRVAL